MLKKLLSLLPVSIVRKIGNSIFANLQDRGEIKILMVDTEELIYEGQKSSTPETFYYLGLSFRIYESDSFYPFYWCVFDRTELISEGQSDSKENAIESAKKWIENNAETFQEFR
jgi:hypothetical protein